MSHWNGYEDIFCNEDNGVNNLLAFQNGEEVLESVTFSDSQKNPGGVLANDVRISIYHDGSPTESALPKTDARVRPIYMNDGNSNILDPSLSFVSEKEAVALGITKCSTGSTILDCQGDKISSKSCKEEEHESLSMLCSDYGKRGDVHNKKLGDISSIDTFVGIRTKEQMSGDDVLLSYDHPSIGQFEDFERTFRNRGSTFAQGSTVSEDEISWFSSSSHGYHGAEDTLQSVVLSSVPASRVFNNTSSAHRLDINILPGAKPSGDITEFPSCTDCDSFSLYSDAGKKGKSLIPELAYDNSGIVMKSLTLEQISYESDCRNSNMINTTPKDLSTIKGKKINPTYGSTVQSSLSGRGITQNTQDQELLSFLLPASQPCFPHVMPKKTLFTESLASNCLYSYNPQPQMSEILKSTIVKSSDLPDYFISNNLPSDAHPSIGMLPGPFSEPSTPMEKSKKIYALQQFPAAWVMDIPLEQLAEVSNSSPQRKYKFEDVDEGDKEPGANIGSSTLQDKSCMTSTFIDDVSINAASFQQLQMIMDRLGVRTKLCIRDSLYRLARSAEQSHCYGSTNNISRASSPMRGFQGSKRPAEFLGLSISTNEIERAVAYLLFHKTLGSGTGTADDSIWLRTHIRDPVDKCKDPHQSAS